MSIIYHIARYADWVRAHTIGYYEAESLASEGFIHCSTASQVAETGNRYFRGQRDLVLLCIDEERVMASIRYEAPARDPGSAERFPHVFGSLNLEAVVKVLRFAPGADGSFRLPIEAAPTSAGCSAAHPQEEAR